MCNIDFAYWNFAKKNKKDSIRARFLHSIQQTQKKLQPIDGKKALFFRSFAVTIKPEHESCSSRHHIKHRNHGCVMVGWTYDMEVCTKLTHHARLTATVVSVCEIEA